MDGELYSNHVLAMWLLTDLFELGWCKEVDCYEQSYSGLEDLTVLGLSCMSGWTADSVRVQSVL